MIKSFIHWLVRCILFLTVIVFTIIFIRAFDSRSLLELQVWHSKILESEFTDADSDRITSLDDYLQLEATVFQEMDDVIYENLDPEEQLPLSRYTEGSPVDPTQLPQNWNRTFELIPDDIRGGVLMLHGLTDSPYSMHHLAKLFEGEGYYVLALRMPGHGTIPGALVKANWQDWMAATRLGARHVRNKIETGLPFYIVGYSNGGALAVKYSLESIVDTDLPKPDRLFLFSPMMGVTFFARFSDWHRTLSWIPYFEKFRWLDVFPEYDPFKYNSFPKAAGEQSFLLTRSIHKHIRKLVNSGQLSELPAILTFQSLVDATVLTHAIVDNLYNNLTPNNHELVLFDVNRLSEVDSFFQDQHKELLNKLTNMNDLPYTTTLITNINKESREVLVKTKKPQSPIETNEALGMAWPEKVYSLSHVAIPFSPDDLLYGPMGPSELNHYINIGTFSPRGEKNILNVPTDLLMRLRYNPFYEYMKIRILDIIKK